MRTETYIQLTLLIFGFFIAIISSFTKIIENEKITKWGFFAIIFMLIALGLSVILELVKANKEIDKEQEAKNEYESIINRSDNLLVNTAHALDSLNKNLTLSNENLRKSDLIIESLSQELLIQKQTNSAAIDILTKQQKQLDDAERSLNPVYPFHFYVEYHQPFDYPGMEELVDFFNKAREEYLKSKTFIIDNMQYSPRNDKFRVINYEQSIPDFIKKQPFDKDVALDFTAEDKFDVNNPFNTSNAFLSLRTMYRKNEFNPSARKKFSKMEVDFKHRTILYKIYFTELEIVTYKNELARAIGIKDLINSYLTISTFSAGKVVRAHLYFGSHFNKYVAYWFLDEGTYFGNPGVVTKQIIEKDLFPEYSTMDDYKILYYEAGTQSLNLPFPDLP